MPGLFCASRCVASSHARLRLLGAGMKKAERGLGSPEKRGGQGAAVPRRTQSSTRSTAPGFSTLLPLRPFSDSSALTGMP